MIAAMLINRPKLLMPTSRPRRSIARLQDRSSTLLRSLTDEFGMGLLLISHDLQQVSRYADRVMVMRKGKIVEEMASATRRCQIRLYAGAMGCHGHPPPPTARMLPVYGEGLCDSTFRG